MKKSWYIIGGIVALVLLVLAMGALTDDKPQKPRKAVAGKVAKKKKKKKAPAPAPAAVPVVAEAPALPSAPPPAAAAVPAAQPAQPVEWVPEVGVTYIFEWRTVAEAPRQFDELADLLACKVKGLDSPQSREYFRSLVRGRKAGYLPMEAKVLEVDGSFCRVCTPGGISGWVLVDDLRRTRPYPANQ